MSRSWHTALVVASSLWLACGVTQALESPCVGAPTDGGPCPPCAAATDCEVLGTDCTMRTAVCVPRAGAWATPNWRCGDGFDPLPAPPVERCACVDTVCQAVPP